MKQTHLLTLILALFTNSINAQYLQTFEVTSLTTLINDSGWLASGVTVGNNSKLTGSKELQTQLLNTSTSTSTYLTTYFYRGKGYNELQFQHVINNASGKDITLTISALDSVNAVIGTPYVYTYSNASAVTTTWSFYSTKSYKLHFEWSGAKVSSGSSAFLDMVFVNSPFVPLPIKIFNLKAEQQEEGLLIKWNCPESDNIQSFELYKSSNGVNYVKVGEVLTADYTNMGISQYSVVDQQADGLAYYKVKVVDYSGHSTWSNIIRSDNMDRTETMESKLYPVPAAHTLYIENNEDLSNVQMIVTDSKGQVVYHTVSEVIEKGSISNINIETLVPGVYFIQMIKENGAASKSMSFIKQ